MGSLLCKRACACPPPAGTPLRPFNDPHPNLQVVHHCQEAPPELAVHREQSLQMVLTARPILMLPLVWTSSGTRSSAPENNLHPLATFTADMTRSSVIREWSSTTFCEKQSSRSCLFFTSHFSQTPKCSASFSSCSKLSPRAKGSKKLRIPSQLCSTKEVKQKNNATALVYTSGTSGHFRTAKQRSFRVHSALLLPSYTSNGNERSGGDTE